MPECVCEKSASVERNEEGKTIDDDNTFQTSLSRKKKKSQETELILMAKQPRRIAKASASGGGWKIHAEKQFQSRTDGLSHCFNVVAGVATFFMLRHILQYKMGIFNPNECLGYGRQPGQRLRETHRPSLNG